MLWETSRPWLRLKNGHTGEVLEFRDDNKYAQVQGDRWARDAAGTYVSPLFSTVEFLGEAARLDAATMPQMALMVLLFGWGVQ